MELIFKMYLLAIAMNLGVALWTIIEMILFREPPSTLGISFIALSWALMIKFNPVWSELWEKWTKKQ